MKIRSITERDITLAKQIHQMYYAEEMPMPDFKSNYHCIYSITDDNDKPIVIGGVKPIAEVIILTDKGRHIKDKVPALHKMLEAALFTARVHHHEQIHCAIQDQAYERHLKKIGFRSVKGNFLVLDVEK